LSQTAETSFDWAGKRVVVTGGGGVLGTALIAALREFRPAALLAPARADCDLLNQSAVFSMLADAKPDIVFHLAGRVSGIQGNLSFAGQAYYENALMNMNVVEGARLARTARIVAAGTTAVYSDNAPLPMKESDIGVGRPHGSEAGYAAAKLGLLAHLEAYKTQYGLPFAYMVCTNLYGPNDRFDESYGHVVPSLISRFHRLTTEGAPTLTVWGDGTPTRDFLHAADAARAFICCAEKGDGVYNTATGLALPIRALVEAIAATSGFRGGIHWDTDKPNGQQTRAYNVERLRALGWEPRLSLQEGIADTYAWYARMADRVRR
jgi:GDP-L-fucose synthase